MPLTLLPLLLLFGAAIILVTLIQVGAISIAFEKLGLSPQTGLLVLVGSLIGSGINIPVYFRTQKPGGAQAGVQEPIFLRGFPGRGFTQKTVIAVNVGGCLIPGGLSLYLLFHQALDPVVVALALIVVSATSYRFSRPIPGIGIGMPVLLAPLVSALVALLLDPAHSAPLAYISGTMGVLVGADLLRLRDLDRLHAPVASIGGAGTFDGIFLTGIVAALLA